MVSLLHISLIVFVTLIAYQRHLFVREHVVYDHMRKEFSDDRYFRNSDGLLVHYRRLGRNLEKPKAIILVCHGYDEHMLYYEDMAHVYNNEGWLVFGVDHIGHGESEGERAYVESVLKLADDFILFAQKIKMEYPQIPKLLHAHSMGGAIGT